jgi:pimeloyl-ACP methyl ester carboxylesterase
MTSSSIASATLAGCGAATSSALSPDGGSSSTSRTRLDRLPEIDCPALTIVGAEDHGTPPEMARQIHASLRGSERVVIERAGHLSNIEQPAAFNDTLLGLLERVAERGVIPAAGAAVVGPAGGIRVRSHHPMRGNQ